MMILVGLGAFVFTLLGGLLAGKVSDKRHLALGLAGGLMLGVIAFDIIPESLKISHLINGIPWAMVTLALGFVAVHFLEHLGGVHHTHAEEDSHSVPPSIFALIGHSLLDGLGIGLAFHVSHALGLLVAVAVLVHDIADGFNTMTIAQMHGADRRKALSLLLTDAMAPMVGILAASVVTVSAAFLGPLLGLFGGSLLYLATSQIIPEAHASHSSRLTFGATALGIIAMFFAIGLVNA